MNLIYCSNLISEKENVGLTNADRMFTIRSCSTLLFPALLHFYTFTLFRGNKWLKSLLKKLTR